LNDAVKAGSRIKKWALGEVMMPLRLALVGSLMGPDVFFEIASLIGIPETVARIETAVRVG
jgi:glutamyl-tRNA synthetase